MMHNLAPRLILEQYAQDREGGRFPAIGLFVDISGFSGITDTLMEHGQHGAEVLAGLMRNVFEPMIESVYAYGGFVSGFAGDAFTALFPVEGSESDPYGRALAAAWLIQKHMADAGDQGTPYGHCSLSAKVGLADGETAWGILRSENGGRAAYYFRGTAIDGCAAAEQLARPGDIVAQESFCQRLGNRAVTERVGESEDIFRRISAILGEVPPTRDVSLEFCDPEAMARFYPAEIVDRELAGEFRQTVTVFISLPTVRTEAQLEIFMRSLFSLQDQYGGLLNRLDFGDKGANLLLFWGAPVAHENDIERALDLVLALQLQTSTPIRAGITYYISHAGFIGSALREEYTCFGRGVNLAARFMTAAPRGEIWLDERSALRAEYKYEIEFEGEMSFKGFSKRQKVYSLIERKENLETIYQGSIVGREAELARLTELVSPLSKGKYGGLYLIWGEAGMGKSRLVQEFRASDALDNLEHTWAFCQADRSMGRWLHPFRYWLRHYFGQSEGQTEARNKRAFNRRLDGLIAATDDGELAAELDRTRSFIGALLELHWPDSLYEQLEPENRLENICSGLIIILKAECCQRPVIVHLDDAQWIDDYSAELIRRLVTSAKDDEEGYPLAILLAARPEGELSWVESDLIEKEINLSELSADDLEMLAAELLGGPPGGELVAMLFERAEGNPFFAEQIVRHLKEGGWLEEAGGRWRLKDTFRERPLPTDVRALLVARLDRLSREVKEVVQTAAVLGREFELQLLVKMLKDDDGVPSKAEQVHKAGIWALIDRLRYMFKHLLLQDAAYQMQMVTRRKSLHRLAAETLTSLHSGDLGPYHAELAYHYENAGESLTAADSYTLAGARANEMGAMRDACRYYTRALALIPEDDLDRRWPALLGRQEVSYILGDLNDSEGDIQALFTIARASNHDGRLARAHFESASMAQDLGDYRSALEECEASLALSDSVGDRNLTARVWGVKVVSLTRLGQMDEAQAAADEALAAAEAAGDEQLLSQTLNNVANYYMAAGDYSRAAMVLSRQVEIQRQLGKLVGQTYGLLNLAYNQLQLGLYESARETMERSMEGSIALGARRLQAYNQLNLSVVHWRLGDYKAAVQAVEVARPILREAKDEFGEAVSMTYRGLAQESGGLVRQARELFGEAQQRLAEIGAPAYAADALAGLARCWLALEEIGKAENEARKLWTHLVEKGPEGLEFPIKAYVTCAQVFSATGAGQHGKPIIEAGYSELIKRAGRISDGAWRRSFLENVPEHKALIGITEEMRA